MNAMKELLEKSTAVGQVDWIGLATESRGPITAVETAQLVAGAGITGEHHFRPESASKRQVTLIQAEHLVAVATLLGRPEVRPDLLRRNIVVSGINLGALRHQRFRIGTAVLTGTGSCPPCSRMEETLGTGGYAATMGHGGITAVVEESGEIRVGDRVIGLGVVPSG